MQVNTKRLLFCRMHLQKMNHIEDVGVTGIAKLLNNFYISYENSNQIDVFETCLPHKRTSRIDVQGVDSNDIKDIASCAVNHLLYVSDNGNQCVWRIDFNLDRSQTISRFAIVEGPCTLSVGSDGRLLVVSRHHNRVDIFHHKGYRLNCVHATPEMSYILHAIESGRGTILVSHGYVDFVQHKVCEFSADGKSIIRSYGGMCGYGQFELYQPEYMATNLSDQCVFVADSGNERIQLLDKELVLKSTIPTKGFRAWRLFYDSKDKLLIVGASMYGLKIISVYQ